MMWESSNAPFLRDVRAFASIGNTKPLFTRAHPPEPPSAPLAITPRPGPPPAAPARQRLARPVGRRTVDAAARPCGHAWVWVTSSRPLPRYETGANALAHASAADVLQTLATEDGQPFPPTSCVRGDLRQRSRRRLLGSGDGCAQEGER